jgi:hypothetical protein
MRILKLLYRGWLLIGTVLGWINTRILLSLVFFLLMTPIAFARRFGRARTPSGWHERTAPEEPRASLERLY